MPTRLDDALDLHRRGALAEAARGYRAILAERPESPDPIHLLGVVALQEGDPARAAEWIARAIALEPREAAYHGNLAEAYRLLGRVDRAIAAGRSALRLRPDYPEAASNLGLALMSQGRAAEAVAEFEKAVRLQPGFASAHNNLGNARLKLKDHDGAMAAFRRAVELAPDLAEARTNLGQLLVERGDADEALRHCEAAVRLRPGFAEAISNLGNALRRKGRIEEARRCYDEAIRLAPGVAMIHNNRAQALQEEGRFDEATAGYLEAIRLDPDSARFHANLASVAADREDHDLAAARFEQALDLDPDHVPSLAGLGAARRAQGRHAEALACIERALEIEPGASGPRCSLAAHFEEQGDFDAARREARAVLDRHPDHAPAWGLLATLDRARLTDEDLARMQALLDRPDPRPAARAPLHFGLAQVLDARDRFDEAAAHLERANALALADDRRLGRTYDPDDHARFLAGIASAFTPAFFDRLRGAGSASERPVFIVGLPRSGTTLTEQVLASHPRVHGAGELSLAHEAFRRLPACLGLDVPPLEALARLDVEAVGRAAESYLARLAEVDASADRVVDKMPDNYLYLGLLAALFPRARFIHCRRDLRDVAVSCWMTNFAQIPWTNDFGHIAGRFRGYVGLMDHWRATLPVPVLEVAYEDLVADLEGQARRLVAACGLDWDPACLEFHRTQRPIRTASVGQVRQPIYTRSVARWRRYESPLAPLFAAMPPGHGRGA